VNMVRHDAVRYELDALLLFQKKKSIYGRLSIFRDAERLNAVLCAKRDEISALNVVIVTAKAARTSTIH
jgi:hypothetical protein